MYTLFNYPSNGNPKKINLGNFDRVMRAHRENLTRVVNHYRLSNHAVKSNHLLVRILQSLPSSLDLDLMVYRDRVEDIQDDLIRHFEFTSSINVGKSFFPGIFLGDDSEEIIVCYDSDFSISDLRTNWKKYSPVRFLRHPKTNLNFEIPNGESKPGEKGVSVILLDIPLLACQYYLWRKEEKLNSPDMQKTPMQFIFNYPLSNSIHSFADISYFNNLLAIFNGEQHNDVRHTHPFFLNNYYRETITGNTDLLHRYLDRRESFHESIESMESIFSSNLREAQTIKGIVGTRQVKWALSIARVPLIGMLMLWQERSGGNFNRGEINKVKKSLKQLQSDKSLNQLGSRELLNRINQEIAEEIKAFL